MVLKLWFPIQEIVGVWLSTTVIVFEQVLTALVPSSIVQVTVVSPLLKTTPAREFEPEEIVAPVNAYVNVYEQLSDTVGFQLVPDLVYVQTPKSVFTVWFATHEIVGDWLSVTVTLWIQVAVLPEPSSTVHVTVVTPLLNTTPAKEFEPEPVVAPLKA